MKEEIRKLNETLDTSQMRIKELESSLYKVNIILEEEKRKVQDYAVKIEYLENSNVKLNEKVALGENQRETIVKSIVSEK